MRKDAVPNTFLVSGIWPDGELSIDAPLAAHYGRHVAQTLKRLKNERGLGQRGLAELSGVHHNTVGRVLRGEVYPDLATLARLEQALDVSLYPTGLHRRIHRPRTSGSG
ncbi:helix-turn-helix domain-containing protein [Actinomadura luteofluorescens]|uniref:Ribosome-binding protein aMBF1 (Putative translation factor) n=1 Tax=Actinomadura luteofluorescens TaxID=46163 RepID=A0A7Y9JLV5_9ACTN|nr:helix-turn-helix transcriptional regulator [Actinomadura luteofluorescens]NYD51909.1 ribosome-binding protein aMBF1 (putative translation factor) [Actinomadura luteofluorescens]